MSQNLLLISDVDDTLRATHVRFPLSWINRGIRATNSFAGMNDLYLRWRAHTLKNREDHLRCLKSRGLNGTADRMVVYVTAAINKIQWFPNLFLVSSKFPIGNFIGRHWGSRRDFKVKKIREEIQLWHDRDIILIGDNGEYDPEVFCQMKEEFPDRTIWCFVHVVYPIAVPSPCQAFFTAADLAIFFHREKWISTEDLEAVIGKVARRLDSKPERVLPQWSRALDSQKQELPQPPEELSQQSRANLEFVYTQLKTHLA